MNTDQEAFPHPLQLWRGAILSTIAWAIWVAHHPFFTGELSWDGPNYVLDNSQGTKGTITFAEDRIVGAFFDLHSSRSPFRSMSNDYALAPYFVGMPLDLLTLAYEQTLQYLVEELEGTQKPIITAAFWSDHGHLTATEPWPEVIKHGAHIVRKETMEMEEAIAAWQEDCELSSIQVDLLRSLFTRKIEAPNDPLILGRQDRDVLTSDGDEGLEGSRELLAAVGITLP